MKGVPNRATLPVAELCAFHNVSPIEVLIEYCKPIEQGLSPQQMIERSMHRFNAAKELCQYLYPKRKALEVSGVGGDAITIDVHSAALAEMKAVMTALLLERKAK